MKKILISPRSKKLLLFLVVAIPCIAYMVRALVMLDPDFGWHYKMGEVIIREGVPDTDPFSYTMPSFPFVDHEWGTNIFIYYMYSYFGWRVLAVVYTAIAFSAFFLVFLKKKFPFPNRFSIFCFLFLLLTGAILPYFGIRPQVESWFLLSFLTFIIFDESFWKRWKYVVPFLFVVWVNVHGSFGAGIVILCFILGLRTIRFRSIIWSDVIVCFLSILATFVNPYSWHVWREVFQQITDSSIHWTIQEWRSSLLSFNAQFLFLMTISGILLFKYRTKYVLEELGLFIALLMQAISATRHVPLWAICTVPLVIKGFVFLYGEIKNIPYGKERFKLLFAWAAGISVILFAMQAFFSITGGANLDEEHFYPKNAVAYLHEHDPSGHVFSEYGWGGYLLWKLPHEKTFVDGRMATWQWKDNPPDEEAYVFDIYKKVVEGELGYESVFDKYTVTTVLWPNQKNQDPLDARFQKLVLFIQNLLGKKQYKPLIQQLKDDNWQKVYEDDISVIYERPNSL